jgi:hypothetical protein|nr:MAG TPA: hypothetical protein [Caudoviricetes sp.]
MQQHEIDRRFDYSVLPDDVRADRVRFGSECKNFAEVLNWLPECREKALAFTALEEVMMWGNAAIARGYKDAA